MEFDKNWSQKSKNWCFLIPYVEISYNIIPLIINYAKINLNLKDIEWNSLGVGNKEIYIFDLEINNNYKYIIIIYSLVSNSEKNTKINLYIFWMYIYFKYKNIYLFRFFYIFFLWI